MEPKPSQPADESRISQIATDVSLVQQARGGDRPALHGLVLRYQYAIRRFVSAILHGRADAEDVASDIIQGLIEGKGLGWEPVRGTRFRHYLKKVVRNRVYDHLRARGWPAASALPDDVMDRHGDTLDALDAEATAAFRTTVLRHALRKLFQEEVHAGRGETVPRLVARLGPSDRPEWLELPASPTAPATNAQRQQLFRARRRLTVLLREEVTALLPDPTPETIEEELLDLGLYSYLSDDNE